MRHGLIKLACIFTMMALILTGCSLIEIDPIKQVAEDIENVKEDYSNVIVKYDGGQITKGEMMADYYSQYTYLSYLYSIYYGTSVSLEEAEELALTVAQTYMNTVAVLAKAEELGVTLTEDEITQCESYAKVNYDTAYQNAYDSATGETEEERAIRAEYNLAVQGLSYEYYYHQQEWDFILTKVQDIILADVPDLTDEELITKLTEQAVEDEATYANDAYTFETNMTDETIAVTWMPEGYRTVKHILITPDATARDNFNNTNNAIDTANTELASLNNELLEAKNAEEGAEVRAIEDIQADIDAKNAEIDSLKAELETYRVQCLDSVADKTAQIYERLEAGEAFEDLIAEFGEDPGMQDGVSAQRGYYVSAVSEAWDYNFRNAAMELENVGDYTVEPVVGSSGVHIIYYNSDVTPGPVALDDVRDVFAPIAQDKVYETYFNGECAKWVKAFNPRYNVNNFFANEE